MQSLATVNPTFDRNLDYSLTIPEHKALFEFIVAEL